MKRISVIAAPDLQEDGMLLIKGQHAASVVVGALSSQYDVRVILRGQRVDSLLPENCKVTLDASVPEAENKHATFPTYTQKNYRSWEHAGPISEDEADYLLCMDAYCPWALAACQRVRAGEKILWVNETPSLFLLDEDVPIFRNIYSGFDRIIFSEEKQQAEFAELFPGLKNIGEVVPYPIDGAYYQQLANAEWDNSFSAEEANIVIQVSFDAEYPAMFIPRLVMESRRLSEGRHFYIFGNGKYRNHLLRDMVMHDVCEEITLAEEGALYPMLAACDYIMLLPGEDNKELCRAAAAYGKKMMQMEIAGNSLVLSECGSPCVSLPCDAQEIAQSILGKAERI